MAENDKMEISSNSDPQSGPKSHTDTSLSGIDKLDIPDGEPASLVTQRRNPRVYVRSEVVRELVKLGVPDDTASIGNALGDLAEMSINLGMAYLPDASDMAAMQQAVNDRLDEMDVVNLGLMRMLSEIGGMGEYRTLLYAFKEQMTKKGESD